NDASFRMMYMLPDRLCQHSSAVATYEAFAKRLAADLEVEPAAETKALLTAVQARQTVAPVDPSSATLDRARRTAVTRPRPMHRVVRPVTIAAALAGLLLASAS